MKSEGNTVPDPTTGVAGTAIATSIGQPGGHVLTEADIPELIIEGSPLDEILALELASPEHVEEIVKELVDKGLVPAERFTFIR